jgi:hypothetical protein
LPSEIACPFGASCPEKEAKLVPAMFLSKRPFILVPFIVPLIKYPWQAMGAMDRRERPTFGVVRLAECHQDMRLQNDAR